MLLNLGSTLQCLLEGEKKKRQGEFNIQAKNNILSFVTDKHFIMR